MGAVQSRRGPIFGLSITPNDAELAFRLARTADESGLDIVGIQDHPYNGTFFDTWTLISTLAMSTRKIRFFADVSDLPMRPPAMLAKTAATLDIITKGRVELGLGTGAFWDAIHAYGGPRRSPSEAIAAYEEALRVIHLIWNYGKGRTRVSFPGKYYQLDNAQAGPSPAHKMSIWSGAVGPGMMRLIGRLTDGWVIPLSTYMSSAEIRSRQQLIDESAKKNKRSPDSIRRIANVVGAIDESRQLDKSNGDKAPLVGPLSYWIDWIASSYRDLGVDTFIFWPSIQGHENEQVRVFAEQVVPKARSLLTQST